MNKPIISLVDYFADLPDPCFDRRKLHRLTDILCITISEWENLPAIGMVESTRELNGEKSLERRYYLTSVTHIKDFARAVRRHWSVENKLHWILDVAFKEDLSRIRVHNAAENFSILRRIALNLLKQEKTLKIGIESKRLRAGWGHDYLLKILKL